MGTTTTLVTAQEFFAMPEAEGIIQELIGGEVVCMAGGHMPHEVVKKNIIKALVLWLAPNSVGEVFAEAMFQLDEHNILIPDLSVLFPGRISPGSTGCIQGAPAASLFGWSTRSSVSFASMTPQVDRSDFTMTSRSLIRMFSRVSASPHRRSSTVSSPQIKSRPAIAASALAVPHSRIRELAEMAMSMDGVLKLYFGESNMPTPEFIKRAAQKAMADGFTFYTENAGLPSLRKALARYYQELHGVEIDAAREIVVTASGVQALNLAIRCILDPGDEALVLTPAWPNGAANIAMANGVPVEIAQPLVGDRYQIDFGALEAAVTPRTRMLLYTSPSNPLGWVATVDDQRRLLEFARRHGLWLMADEVYERLNYTGPKSTSPTPTILKLATRDDAVIVVQSFSKAYCMTGWRLGWLVARHDLAARATQLNEFVVSHAPSFTQRAGETALLWGENALGEMLARLKQNRDFCLAALAKMPGVTVPKPDGAFYLFPKIASAADSFDFCKRLLLETHVGLSPGVAFGSGGEGSVRICYAADRPILEEAMARLGVFLSQ
jgi:aspartate aminotransferase